MLYNQRLPVQQRGRTKLFRIPPLVGGSLSPGISLCRLDAFARPRFLGLTRGHENSGGDLSSRRHVHHRPGSTPHWNGKTKPVSATAAGHASSCTRHTTRQHRTGGVLTSGAGARSKISNQQSTRSTRQSVLLWSVHTSDFSRRHCLRQVLKLGERTSAEGRSTAPVKRVVRALRGRFVLY